LFNEDAMVAGEDLVSLIADKTEGGILDLMGIPPFRRFESI